MSGIVVSSLNPYCSGRWSRTIKSVAMFTNNGSVVLILIVVDDGLVRFTM